MKLLLHNLPDAQLYDLHEATSSMIEARNREKNPNKQIELTNEAFQLRPTLSSTQALATAHTRWMGVRLIETKPPVRRRRRKKKKGTERK